MVWKSEDDTDYHDLPEFDEIVKRVFGTSLERPCNNPDTIECRMWACQAADCCQFVKPAVH